MIRSSLIHNSEMQLDELLEAYCASRECSPRYVESLRRTVRKAKASGLEKICQLQPDTVNRFLGALTVGPTTAANIRRELLTLWRYAFEEGVTETLPVRVRKVRPKHTPPQAWSMLDLVRMLETAERDETPLGGVSTLRRCDVLPSWIGLAFDTGLRFSDVLGLTAQHVRNGCISTTAGKTGKALVRKMSDATDEAVTALLARSPDGTLFGWALTRRRAIKMWRAFLDRHGFGGSCKWLRRSCATYVEREQPGAATRYLQHSHPMLAGRHYLDASLFDVPAGPPPIR